MISQSLLQSTEPMKHQIIYIGEYLSKSYTGSEATEKMSSEPLDELNLGGLFPTTVLFVRSNIRIQTLMQTPQTRCRSYLIKLLSYNPNACKSLANILLKSFVTANSDNDWMFQTKGEALSNWVSLWVDRFLCLSTVLNSFDPFYLVLCMHCSTYFIHFNEFCLVLFETVSIYYW